eukprot:Rmarinus@m.13639
MAEAQEQKKPVDLLPQHVSVHPVVGMNILDHYSRRYEGSRLIGTLLGVIEDGVVDIRNSFPVPHSENDKTIALDVEYHKTMQELHSRVNPKEVVIGWYAVGAEDLVNFHTETVHEFYRRESSQAVNLLVEARLEEEKFELRASVMKASLAEDESVPMNDKFVSLPVYLSCCDAEKVGVDFLRACVKAGTKSSDAKPTFGNELDNLEKSVRALIAKVEEVKSYLDKVCKGEVKPDKKLGRHLADTLMATPVVDTAEFERGFTTHVQDLLMAGYLSNLVRTQLYLYERLQQIV